ncbi:MAG: anaerobic ribonucleoside-triphosphate reductase activating protein [Ignavibacteriales bacterium]|nr:anaerobic ribonucleoside-triphosphate reductase activating protein [Ignavibacteriales bacterium]
MIVGGFKKSSLIDFPDRVAAVVFTKGCNFRCPFCHNARLALPTEPVERYDEAEILEFLDARRGKLDGVVVTGGEPTLHDDLIVFLRECKAMGYETKLDTNGTNPDALRALFDEGLLDFTAMDVKAPFRKYPLLTGVEPDTSAIVRSMQIVAASGIPYEFRTTVVPGLLENEDVEEIRALVGAGARYRTQEFVPAKTILDPTLLDRLPNGDGATARPA